MAKDEIKIIGDLITYRGIEVAEIRKGLPASLIGDFLEIIGGLTNSIAELDYLNDGLEDIEDWADVISNKIYCLTKTIEKLRGKHV